MIDRWHWNSLRVRASVALAALLLASGAALADPPGRVVRLGYMAGDVSFLPAGATDWVQANLNRPLWTGDRLWTAPGARAELQMGNAALRVAPGTSVSIVNFDDRTEQFEVAQGSVRLLVRSMDRDDAVEIDTPNLAFSIRGAGDYRIDVDAEATTVAVYRGQAEAFGTQNAYMIAAGERYRFGGTDLADYQPVALGRGDAFDAWASERVAFEERSVSARYVAPDVIGYADLDTHGSWRTVPSYGAVWFPTSVAADWAPYRYGHWVWLDPWGWTWVDDAPWGFAPFHYGRWALVESRWCWVPGPRTVRPVYAPALVAFVGGPGFGVSVSFGAAAGVAWFPLAPGEVYRPAYAASRDYFTRVNVTNTVVNVTNVTNIYNNPTQTNIRYVNVNNVNAVTAVPTQAFVDARPVQRAAMKVDSRVLQQAQMVAAPAQLAPVRASFVGSAPPAQAHPTPAVIERTVIAKQAPPPAPASIDKREEALRRQPGKPLDQAELHKLAPPAAAERPNVKVVQPTAAPKPMASAPPAVPAEKGAAQPQPPAPMVREQGAQPPQAAQPPRAGPPTAMEKEKEKQGPIARPEPSRPTPAAPPEREARPRGAPTPAAPPTEATGRPEPQRPPQAAMRQEEPKAQGPLQRPGAPPKEPERVTPPTANAPAPQPGARPETAKAPERTQPPSPSQRPETARAPERVQPTPPQRPETAKAPEPVKPPTPPQRPETAKAPERVQPPSPPQRPEAATAPRPAPREAAEPPRQQQAQAPQSRLPEGRPQPVAPAPQAASRPTEKGPPSKGGPEKEKDKDKKEENK